MTAPVRAVVCSVVFLDIVGYSKQSVSIQLNWKQHFNDRIEAALGTLDRSQCVLLDTGDGAALCFLGSPEDALSCAAAILSAPSAQSAEYQVRTGINLGSVKIVVDFNDRQNVVGDGINVAQRIMSFAGEGQILASRSFYEMVGCISQEHQRMFCYQGSYRDKHTREHDVYELLYSDAARARRAAQQQASRGGLSEEQLYQPLAQLLAKYLGPFASKLLRKELDAGLRKEQLIGALAKHIEDAKHRAEFERDAEALDLAQTSRGAKLQELAAANAVELSPEQHLQIEEALLRLLGPVARVLLRKELREASTLSDFIERLSSHVDHPEERQAFSAQLKKVMGPA
jgi:class 3 adenylate cyclase